jgi:hypothetical protein
LNHLASREYSAKTIALKGQSFRLNLGAGESLEISAADILP